MNRQQLRTILFVGVILGILGLFVYQRDRTSWRSTARENGIKVLPELPINGVSQVTIQQTGGELALMKKNDLWTVRERFDYPADFGKVRDLLRKFWDMKAVQTLKVGPSQFARLQLVAPGKDASPNAGTLLTFSDPTGKVLQSLILGKTHVKGMEDAAMGSPMPEGRYILSQQNADRVMLVKDALSDVNIQPENWLDHEFIKIEKAKSVSVAAPAAKEWKLSRDSEAFPPKLDGAGKAEALDSMKMMGVLNAFVNANFTDVLPIENQAAKAAFAKPVVVRYETFEGFVYILKLAKKGNEDAYLLQVTTEAVLVTQRTPGKDEKPDDVSRLDREFKEQAQKLEAKLKREQGYSKWIYVINKFTADAVLKDRKDLLQSKEVPAKLPARKPMN